MSLGAVNAYTCLPIDTHRCIFLSALVRKLETRLSNSNDKADVLAQGMRDISLEITNFIDRINERSTDGKLLIGKLNGLVEEFEELKMHFGIVD